MSACPDENRIGAVGEGWACAMTLLTGKRLGQGGEGKDRGIADLIRYAAETPRGARYGVGQLRNTARAGQSAYAEEQAEKHFQARLRTMVSRGENPGATASIVKLAYTNRYQKMSGLAMELREMSGIAVISRMTNSRQSCGTIISGRLRCASLVAPTRCSATRYRSACSACRARCEPTKMCRSTSFENLNVTALVACRMRSAVMANLVI